MIEFSIKNKAYTIGDITIADYYKVQNLLVTEGMQSKLQIVSHLSGASTKELALLEQFQFLSLWNSIVEGPLKHSDNSQLYKHFVLDGKLYGFMEFSKMAIGEFVDMEVLKQDPMKAAKLHIMMAILYRPATQIAGDWIVTDPYDGDSVMDRAEVFKTMPLKYVYGALNFFLLVQRYLLNNMLDSLTATMTPEMMKELTQDQKELLNIMTSLILELQEIGPTHSMDWQAMILPKSKRLQDLALSVSSTTFHTEKTKTKKKSLLGRLQNLKTDKDNK